MVKPQDKRYGRGPISNTARWGTIGTATVLGTPLALKTAEWTAKGLLGGARWAADATVASYKGIYDKTKNWMKGPDLIPETHRIPANAGSGATIVPESHRIPANAGSGAPTHRIPGGQTITMGGQTYPKGTQFIGSTTLPDGTKTFGASTNPPIQPGSAAPGAGSMVDDVAQATSKLDDLAGHVPTQNSIAQSQGMTRMEWLRNTKVGQAVGKIMRSRALGSANQVSMLSMAFGPTINAYKAMQNQEGSIYNYH